MRRELVSTDFDCRRISVIVHSSASDKLAVESFTRLDCLGLSRIAIKEREIVSFQSKICELVSGKLSKCLYSAISRKVVGKNVHDNPER